MAVRMASLNHTTTGELVARKGIPADVRNEYFRLYGVRWEERLTLPAKHPNTKPPLPSFRSGVLCGPSLGEIGENSYFLRPPLLGRKCAADFWPPPPSTDSLENSAAPSHTVLKWLLCAAPGNL
jgi:hypothetical protein